jgi:hypothetical protein
LLWCWGSRSYNWRICVGLLPEMIKARRRITAGRLWEAIIVVVSLGLLLALVGVFRG